MHARLCQQTRQAEERFQIVIDPDSANIVSQQARIVDGPDNAFAIQSRSGNGFLPSGLIFPWSCVFLRSRRMGRMLVFRLHFRFCWLGFGVRRRFGLNRSSFTDGLVVRGLLLRLCFRMSLRLLPRHLSL